MNNEENNYKNMSEKELIALINSWPDDESSYNIKSVDMLLEHARLTENMLMVIIKKYPKYICYANIRDILLSGSMKYDVSDLIVHNIIEDKIYDWTFSDLSISDETWQYIINEYHRIHYACADGIIMRPDCPKILHEKEIRRHALICDTLKKHMSADDLILYYDLYRHIITRSFLFDEFESEEWIDAIKRRPELFKEIKKPTANICDAAVRANPENIQYIKNPSEKLKVLAIQLNPECKKYVKMTKRTYSLLGIQIPKELANPYPNKYYLVSFEEDLCDEGYLNHHMVVDGKDMVEFMKQTFTIGFGNLRDDNERLVRNCANVQAITDEEYNVLKKLGLDSKTSGYFCFD